MIFLQPDSKSSSRSKLHLQPILSFYITIFMPVIFSLFIRIYTVAENFSPEHPFRQETQIQIHRTCFPIGQSSDDPVLPTRRAVTIYSPIFPCNIRVSSATTGKPAIKRVHSGSLR